MNYIEYKDQFFAKDPSAVHWTKGQLGTVAELGAITAGGFAGHKLDKYISDKYDKKLADKVRKENDTKFRDRVLNKLDKTRLDKKVAAAIEKDHADHKVARRLRHLALMGGGAVAADELAQGLSRRFPDRTY